MFGDKAAVDLARSDWQKNAVQIADFLTRGLKCNVNDPGIMRRMMLKHLAFTEAEVTARLQANWIWRRSVFQKVEQEILAMSDMLSECIGNLDTKKQKV